MPTRFYLPSTGAADVSPPFTLQAAWTEVDLADRLKTVTTRISSAMASTTRASATTAGTRQLHRQYVSAPIEAQTIPVGTVKGTIRVLESAVNDNLDNISIKILVVSNDGQTLRGAILNLGEYLPVLEWATALTARRAADGDATLSVVASAGDRIVIELGHRNSTTGTSVSGNMNFGDNSATDLPDNQTEIAADNPFIELSMVITFQTGTQFTQSVAGALTFSGAFVKQDSKIVTGGLSFSGAFTKLGQKVVTGGLTFSGAITKQGRKAVTGSLSFIGSLAASLLRTIAFTAALTFSGTFTKQAGKAVTGGLTFSGGLIRLTLKTLAGGLSFAGAITKQVQRALAGSLPFAGALSSSVIKVIAFTATLTFSGALGKQGQKSLAAALSFVGAILQKRLIRGGRPFLFTAANWGAQFFFLEVFMRATTGIAEAELYNVTDGVVVAGSTVTTTSTSLVRLRSGAIILVDGKEYRLQLLRLAADGGAILGGQLIARL